MTLILKVNQNKDNVTYVFINKSNQIRKINSLPPVVSANAGTNIYQAKDNDPVTLWIAVPIKDHSIGQAYGL